LFLVRRAPHSQRRNKSFRDWRKRITKKDKNHKSLWVLCLFVVILFLQCARSLDQNCSRIRSDRHRLSVYADRDGRRQSSAQLTDEGVLATVTSFSEPSGHFFGQFVSNELATSVCSRNWLKTEKRRCLYRRRPEQNFTYIVALQRRSIHRRHSRRTCSNPDVQSGSRCRGSR